MSLASDYRLRRPCAEDRTPLEALARSIWPDRDPTALHERWWWRDDPPHAWVAEHVPSGAIAAICGARRVRFRLGDEEMPASSICDWYVAPRHAGKGLGRALVRQSQQGHAFMFASAASDSAAAGLSKLGWGGDTRYPTCLAATPVVASLGAFPRSRLAIDSRTLVAPECGEVPEIDRLWQTLHWDRAAMMVRDASHMSGHLRLAPPGRRYTLLVAQQSGRPRGYLLWRVMPRRALRAFPWVRIGLISDFLVHRRDTATLRALLGFAARQLVRQGVGLMLVMAGDPLHLRLLDRLGFVSPRTPLIGPTLTERMSNRTMYLCPEGIQAGSGGWHFTFADNDTDLTLA